MVQVDDIDRENQRLRGEAAASGARADQGALHTTSSPSDFEDNRRRMYKGFECRNCSEHDSETVVRNSSG